MYENEYEKEEEKKFKLTRGMVLLAVIVFILIIVIVIVIASSSKSRKDEYTVEDFKKLESRMEEETETYLSTNKIELTEEVLTIDLSILADEEKGFIDSSSVKAVNVCKGYVTAQLVNTIREIKAYINCSDFNYKTKGYKDQSETTTTKKVKDTEKPVITIIGNKEVTVNLNSEYKDEGAKATDNIDGDVTSLIKIINNVNTKKEGVYSVEYKVSDKAGNTASSTRKVTVVPAQTTTKENTTTAVKTTKAQSGSVTTRRTTVATTKATTRRITTPPTITLKGQTTMQINAGTKYTEPGYSAKDALGNDLTSRVSVSSNVNTNVAGIYIIKYSVTDSYGNSASKTRTIKVLSTQVDVQAISLSTNNVTINVGKSTTVTAYITPSNATNKTVTWSSSNTSIATVSNGTIVGKKAGKAYITARTSNGKSATTTVIVK